MSEQKRKYEFDGNTYLLTPDQIDEIEDFIDLYEVEGCSCREHPPCAFCTHPGNPLGLEEFIVNDGALERDGLTPEQIAAFEQPPAEPKKEHINGELRRMFRLPTPGDIR